MLQKANWTSEFSQSFKTSEELYGFLGWEKPAAVGRVEKSFPVFVPRRLAARMKSLGPDSALAKEFLPQTEELSELGLLDPIGDKAYLKAPQLVHRYPTRALFTATSVCPVHCRFCFRKNELSQTDELFDQDFALTLGYLRGHPEISEIIFTGGDPLTLSNEKLKTYLMGLADLKTVKDIRFHTRYPVILPERIDDGFLTLMDEASLHFRTISLVIHTNHVQEIDEDAEAAILKLHHSPVQLLSQTVLLRSVNDETQTLVELFEKLIDLKVRPYYLHHPDQVRGGLHFYLPLEEGRRIYAPLRKYLPGWALPHYIIDVPGGHGKVPAFNPESANFSGTLLTMDGKILDIQEPLLN